MSRSGGQPASAGTGGASLTAVAVQSSDYTAGAGELVPVDASSGSLVVTLPTAPPDKTVVAVKLLATTASRVATIRTGGTDVLNKAGGPTTLPLSVANQAAEMQYAASSGVWIVTSTGIPLAGMDIRYQSRPLLSGTPAVGQVLTATPPAGAQGVTYQWTRDGVDIAGATASTYTLVTADGGHAIAVRIGFTGIASDVVNPPAPAATASQLRRIARFGRDLIPAVTRHPSRIPSQSFAPVGQKGTFRDQYTVVAAVKDLQVLHGAIYSWGPLGNDITVHTAIEAGGTTTEIEAPTVVTNNTSHMTPALTVARAKGDSIFVRAFADPGATGKLPVGGEGQNDNPGGRGEANNLGASGTDLATGTGTTSLTNTAGGNRYVPIAVFGEATSAQPVVIGYGDSWIQGVGDTTTALADVGFLWRSLGADYPGWNMSQTGARIVDETSGASAAVTTHIKARAAWWNVASQFFMHQGTNDVNFGSTLAQIQAALLKMAGWVQADGPQVIACTVPPRTTSTDSWATTANQTIQAPDAIRVSINQWMRAGAPIDPTTKAAVAIGTPGALLCDFYNAAGTKTITGTGGHVFTAIVDTNGIIEDVQDNGKFKAGSTADGIHPNATYHANIATYLNGLKATLFTA